MNYWLLKSDADTYSFDQMKADKKTFWNGVRNYAARNHMKAMKKGDLCFFYISMGTQPEIVGTVKIVKEAYQDPTTEDPAWVCVDIAYDSDLKRPVSLAEIKADKSLADMALVRISRLSVQPVTKEEWEKVMAMSKKKV